MKLLLTGGTTFVSRYTAEYFMNKGDEVYVLNRGNKEQLAGVHLIKCDRMSLQNALSGLRFDAILDITAYTDKHIRALLESGVSFDDYIFISSSAVYPEKERQPFSEETSVGYNTVWGEYGINKVCAERYLQSRVPNAYILRPPYLYGRYENLYRAPFVFDCAMKGRPFYLPREGKMRLQFFNVHDLCRFMSILLEKHPGDRVFNVGNTETVTVREWVELCYSAVGMTPEFVCVDKNILQRDYFPFYDYEYALDVSKQSELFSDTVPFAEGLKTEFEWYKRAPNSIDNRKHYFEFIESMNNSNR